MQYTLIARKRVDDVCRTVATQYGTSNGLKTALAYAKRIWQSTDGFYEWEAIECRCENNGDLCEACEAFEIYK